MPGFEMEDVTRGVDQGAQSGAVHAPAAASLGSSPQDDYQPQSCFSCSPACCSITDDYKFEDYIKTNVYITAAISEATSVIDRICLVWVTVVLLGGFASQLDSCNFWLLAGLLFLQGVRYLMNVSIVSIAVKGTKEPSSSQQQASAANTTEAGTSQQTLLPGAGTTTHVSSGAAVDESSVTAVQSQLQLRRRGPAGSAAAAQHGRSGPPGDPDAPQESVTSFRDLPSKHVKSVLQWAATCCYNIRVFSYIARAVLSGLGMANLHSAGATMHVCTAGDFKGQLWSALFAYYAIMAAACLVYFTLTEAYGWWWTLWGMCKTVRKYEHGWSNRSSMYPWTAENHKRALRYTYYLYFKAQHESFAAMMASMRKWDEAPTEAQIALPYPWVEAVCLCRHDAPPDATALRMIIDEVSGEDAGGGLKGD